MQHLPSATQAPRRAIALDFDGGVDRKQLKQIKQRFMALNDARLARAQQAMLARQCDVLKLLPLLYQVNHPLLPGFVDRKVSRGLVGYEPEKSVIQLAKRFSKTFRFRSDRRHKPELLSIFMMGSCGTLAQSEASDVDLWLCHDENLSAEACQRLQLKAAKIDAWANSQGLELHTFLMNPKAFREQREASTVDAESSGSSQHYLLLDEFYRTAILLAGCYPLWWLIPPALESEYAHYTQLLLSKRFVPERDVIDFGSVARIPKSELLGAGLWQLYKSLDAPYKSVLKLLLIEVYAQELPQQACLSLSFKQAVYDDEHALEQLDPYYLVYRRLERYLRKQRDLKRLQLVRKSFYLKVAQAISNKREASNWQQQFMQQVTATWAWPEQAFERLDKRSQWRLERVRHERQQIVNELTHSYRFLSNYARSHNISSSITARDLALLGRKLYAKFQRKAGKIDELNLGIAPDIWEADLALEHSSSPSYSGDHKGWLLYRRATRSDDTEPGRELLRKSSALLEMLAWAHRNGILSKQSRLALQPGDTGIAMNELRALVAALTASLPMPLVKPAQQNFEQAAQVSQLIMFINIGREPLADLSAEGTVRLSERNDSLVYSSQRHNLVKTVDVLGLNSWNELTVGRYELGETLMQCLQSYLQLLLEHRAAQVCELKVYCFSSARAELIASRVRRLFNAVREALFTGSAQRTARYVLEVEQGYFVIEALDQQIRYQGFAERSALWRYLAQAQRYYVPLVLDEFAMPDQHMLRAALVKHQAGQLHICLFEQSDHIALCALDEHGALLQARLPLLALDKWFAMIDEFMVAARERLDLLQPKRLATLRPSLHYWQAQLGASGLSLRPAPLPIQIARYALKAKQCQFTGDTWQFDLIAEPKCFGAELGIKEQYQKLRSWLHEQADYDAHLIPVIVEVTFSTSDSRYSSNATFTREGSILSYLDCFANIQADLISQLG